MVYCKANKASSWLDPHAKYIINDFKDKVIKAMYCLFFNIKTCIYIYNKSNCSCVLKALICKHNWVFYNLTKCVFQKVVGLKRNNFWKTYRYKIKNILWINILTLIKYKFKFRNTMSKIAQDLEHQFNRIETKIELKKQNVNILI